MQLKTILSLLLSSSIALAAPAPAVTERAASCGTGISLADASRAKKSFTASGVVPTLIPSFTPQVKLNVNYPSGAVDLGNQFTTLQTALKPTFQFTAQPGAPADATYSLFLVDPDVPGPNGPPVIGEPRINFLHWYVENIPACSGSGKTVTLYETPTPASTDEHRYTFLVYREPAGYKAEPIGAQVRPAFDLLGYTHRGGLGMPIGGNFFNESITNT